MNWFCQGYRGMYIHAMAFELPNEGAADKLPGPKWNFRMAIRYTSERDDRMFCDSLDYYDDYFTRAAAEQAALHYGKFAIDLIHGLR
ncbi:hypothetical protein [Cupriavidus sp. Marseille-Q8015]